MNRRQFLQTSAGAAALLALRQKAYGYAISPRVRKFFTPLRHFGADIPVADPDITTYPGIDYYELSAVVFRDQLHPDLPAPGTRLYGYQQTNRGGTVAKHLGAAILATRNRPVRIKFTCALPASHIIPFDATIPQGVSIPTQDRAAIHLHGARVPWTSDGGPFHWVSSSGVTGASVLNWLPGKDGSTLTNDYFYPNNQSTRMMWYHDHAVGITRINAYAGVATGYLIQDSYDKLGGGSSGLPFPGEILVFQDKVFWDPAIDPLYAQSAGTALGGAAMGDLWYPYIYDPKIWKLAKAALPVPVPSAVAEMFGDTMLVNGAPYPFHNVSGMVRFRVLNACNARFLNLSFAVENPKNLGEIKTTAQGLPMWAPITVWQIGTEGGFLAAPVLLADTTVAGAVPTPLLLGPAERADLIVDFRPAAAAGVNVILYNDAPAPFPGGSPLFDFSTAGGNAKPGFGPNTRTILKFVVGNGVSTISIPSSAPVELLPTAPDLANGGLMLALSGGSANIGGIKYTFGGTQNLTLNETFDDRGRLKQMVGNVADGPVLMFGSNYIENLQGEQVSYGTIQVWNIFNLTADAHPMHFHLFNVMVLKRQPFKVNQFNGIPVFTAAGRGPDPNEAGWKETVKAYPGECTTVAALVENPFILNTAADPVHGDPVNRSFTFNVSGVGSVTTGRLPVSPRTGQDEYVWHCHILEHEEHDMMHSLNAS